MVIKDTKITVLIENSKSADKPQLQSKHGLSFLIQSEIDDNEIAMMMDTGPSPDALLHNVKVMDVNLDNIDVIVLSHGHYDHTGGLLEVLRQIKKRVAIIGHPMLFYPKLKIMPHLKCIGSPFNIADVESLGGIPLLATNPVKIAEGIITTGEIPRTTEFENVKGFWTVRDQKFSEDIMLDDQSLVINIANKGLVIVSGCAHSGIINTIKHAQKITGNSKVYAVLGGFHLINANNKRIEATINGLENFDPAFIGPCHCTGKNATKKIAKVFGNRCCLLHTGDKIKL